jgi:ribonuclease HI
MTLYKKELQIKALKLKKKLKKKHIELIFDNTSFKNYLLKIIVKTNNVFIGSLFIYYKPTKKTYLLKQQIKNCNINKIINIVWDKLNNFNVYPYKKNIYEAFVDGSYYNKIVGYGSIVYLENKIKTKISGIILNSESRQIAGELKSVIETIKWCNKNGIKNIRINYDYFGIEKFATGEWKAKNKISIEYKNFINNSNINIEWRHINSHTGNIKNNIADNLAKKAITKYSKKI